ncbi:DNA-3-methyladenine glycosylase I [Thalassolituus sp. LLYu03]|uniref:DNA-3-methyladenine glycosylase I n=1 Tax=Thalassolituus sp. LLYu03 TaxID=3421656 RepID=UPI003D2D6E46
MSDAQLHACPWAQGDDYLAYHDQEWGVPSHDRLRLFEKLCLEGQQAGLSWITVLRKREHYRTCFHGFSPEKVAHMTDARIETLLTDAGLIRNRLKLYGIRKNAQALLALEAQGVDFVDFLWQFVGHSTIVNHHQSMADVPAETAEAKAMSKALKKAGFTFVGPTICYAFMQSMGLVNDHLTSCPCHPVNQ